ncbi:MAG: lariat debranching enzyme [Lasallia pustulata]|uniref:Lariat debranching enzyme n=1 Tax=Lasallia pustulata TaxID=136370 RepID=A0A5M8PBU1_9LECA|nr:MAG: lariat debranching enzyme [Lasallia pustulata]
MGTPLRIAVEGCGHGTLHAIYASIKKSCEINRWNGIDLLIIGGDFQAVRNSYDLNCMSVPPKYREIGDFHEYYSGVRKAPYLTIFIGGNHEASNHLWELYYGGWVAPNIYYLGAANMIRLGPLRIAGLSGIWKGYDYNKPHHERLPYNQDDVKSIYHVRELDVRKLMQIRTQIDIGISHDWPRGVEWQGYWKGLFAKKDLFEADARAGKLGSTAAKYVIDRLRPPHWFSAHLHCKYSAVVNHKNPSTEQPQTQATPDSHAATSSTPHVSLNGTKNSEEVTLDIENDSSTPTEAPKPPSPAGPLRLSYDKEWLAITRVFAASSPLTPAPPDAGEAAYRPLIEAEEAWVQEHIVEKGKLEVPENFEVTAPVYDRRVKVGVREMPREYVNPQTVAFCGLVGIGNAFAASEEEREERWKAGAAGAEEGKAGGFGGGRGGVMVEGEGKGRREGRGKR